MKKIKVIMIDAFKPEYLKYAPYLSSIIKKYQWGELEMPEGHWGGVEILFKGKSNTLAVFYKKENSSLSWTKYFSWLENFGKYGRFFLDSMINIIRLVKKQELFRTGKIPLNRLYNFESAIEKHPCKIDGVEYTYFGELDSLGHKYGTKSKEIIQAIKEIDKKVSQRDFDLIFSDHGMADVEKVVSVPKTKDCFLDGDMARYWGNKEELIEIKKMLPLENGEILDWSDKRYGDLIFLANTGILIYPNFWNNKIPDKAMHGYDGKHKEMKAFYIIKKENKKKDIKVKELNNILKEMKKNGK